MLGVQGVHTRLSLSLSPSLLALSRGPCLSDTRGRRGGRRPKRKGDRAQPRRKKKKDGSVALLRNTELGLFDGRHKLLVLVAHLLDVGQNLGQVLRHLFPVELVDLVVKVAGGVLERARFLDDRRQLAADLSIAADHVGACGPERVSNAQAPRTLGTAPWAPRTSWIETSSLYERLPNSSFLASWRRHRWARAHLHLSPSWVSGSPSPARDQMVSPNALPCTPARPLRRTSVRAAGGAVRSPFAAHACPATHARSQGFAS